MPDTKNPSKTATIRLPMFKFDAQSGAKLLQKDLPTQKAKPGLNVHGKSKSGSSAAWDAQQQEIAVVMAHSLTASSDGLNHHTATAYIVDSNSLGLKKKLGWTSSHSFGNTLRMENGRFIGMDLGDNAPRGVHPWSIQSGRLNKGKLAFTFKTKHLKNNAKKSNDNKCYTELAHPGIEDVGDGVLIFFAAEGPPFLDNSKAREAMPRNLAAVKMSKDFKTFLSTGLEDTGGYYNYWSKFRSQKVEGVKFYTNYKGEGQSADSVTRPRTARLGNRTLLVWEVWKRAGKDDWRYGRDAGAQGYQRTEYIEVDDNGDALGSVTVLPNTKLRFDHMSDPIARDGRMVVYGSSHDFKLSRYTISPLAKKT